MDPAINYGYDSTARYTAYAALFLVIIIIIIFIILAVFFFRDQTIAADLVNFWTVQQGTTTSGDSFTASPNSIYVVNTGLASPFNINVVAYSTLATELSASRTTLFKINNVSGNTVNVQGVTVQGTGTVAPGVTGTFMWVNSTTIRRLS